MARLVKLAAAAIAAVVYVWFEAVRSVPLVRSRKHRRRASRSR